MMKLEKKTMGTKVQIGGSRIDTSNPPPRGGGGGRNPLFFSF